MFDKISLKPFLSQLISYKTEKLFCISKSTINKGAKENLLSKFSSIIAIPSTEPLIFSISSKNCCLFFLSGVSTNSMKIKSPFSFE